MSLENYGMRCFLVTMAVIALVMIGCFCLESYLMKHDPQEHDDND